MLCSAFKVPDFPKLAGGLLLGLLLLIPARLFGQGPGREKSTLYILFFHQHVQEMQTHALKPESTAGRADRASRIRVLPNELAIVDESAKAFVAKEEALRQEALQYHQRCKTAGIPPDRVVIHSFAIRRAALAVSTMDAIKAKLSSSGATGIESYIAMEFSKEVEVWR